MKAVNIVGVGVVLLGVAAAGIAVAPLTGQVRQREERGRRFDLGRPGGSQIGASVREVDDADVKREKLAAQSGAAIDEVDADGPAAKAGFKTGDVVVEYDGEKVRSARQFSRLVQETPPGRTAKTTVMRGGRRVDLSVVPEAGGVMAQIGPAMRDLERFGRDFELRVPEFGFSPFDRDVRGRAGRLGIGIAELEPQLAEYFGVKNGVLVTSVTAGSPAAQAGLKAGDVIVSLDGEAVRDGSVLRRRVMRPGTRDVTIGVVRDRKEQTLKLTLPETGPRPGRPI